MNFEDVQHDINVNSHNPSPNIKLDRDKNDCNIFNAYLCGDRYTAYGLDWLHLTIKLSHGIPVVRFVSQIFHPNVCKDGFLAPSIIYRIWYANKNVFSLIVSIQSYISIPDMDVIKCDSAAKYCKLTKKLFKSSEDAQMYVDKLVEEQRNSLTNIGLVDKPPKWWHSFYCT